MINENDERLATKETARAAYWAMIKTWNEAYSKRRELGGEEALEQARNALDEFKQPMMAKFGNDSSYPGCQDCLLYSVIGGPSHAASSRCRSGRKPHCTCDTCF